MFVSGVLGLMVCVVSLDCNRPFKKFRTELTKNPRSHLITETAEKYLSCLSDLRRSWSCKLTLPEVSFRGVNERLILSLAPH